MFSIQRTCKSSEVLLTEVKKSDHDGILKRFRSIVGSIITMVDPPPIKDIAVLFGVSQRTIDPILRHLHSVFDILDDSDRSIRVIHQSFRDFLFAPSRCTHAGFYIDGRILHGDLFYQCLEVMTEHLGEDICGLKHPGTFLSSIEQSTVDYFIPRFLQYACRHWAYHFQNASPLVSYETRLLKFLQKSLLHWIEALSLMRMINHAIITLSALKQHLAVSRHTDVPFLTADIWQGL